MATQKTTSKSKSAKTSTPVTAKEEKKLPLKKEAKPAPAENTTLDTLYTIDASDDIVTLEIKAGDEGQTSDMTVMLDKKEITKEHAGDLAKVSLGKCKALNGKKLSIAAVITDTSRKTNLTSLTIYLKGGLDNREFYLSKTVDEEGKSEEYLCLIEFFNPEL